MRLRTVFKIVAVLLASLVVAAIAIVLNLDVNRFKPEIVAAVRDATGREIEIKGDLKVALWPKPALAVEDVRFANAPWGSEPQMAKIETFAAEVALWPLFSGQLEVDGLRLRGVDLLLETDPEGRGNWEIAARSRARKEGTSARPATDAGLVIPVLSAVSLGDVRLKYRDGATGKITSAAIESLRLKAPRSAPVVFDAALEVNGQALKASGQLGPLAELLDQAKPWPVNVSLEGAGAKGSLKGRIANPRAMRGADLVLSAEGADLGELAKALGAKLPAAPFKLAANLRGDFKGTLALDAFAATLGQSSLTGTGRLRLAGERPRLDGQFTSSLIDLEDFTGPEEERSASAGKGGAGRVIPDAAIERSGLKVLDADLGLKAAKFVAEKAVIQDLDLNFVLNNGSLTIRPLRGAFAGGRIEGEMTLGPVDASLAGIVLNLRGLDAGRIGRDFAESDMVQGKFDADLDLRGHGASLRALASSLEGKVALTMGKGRLLGSYVDYLGADAVTALIPGIGPREDADVNCLVGRFTVKQGRAVADALLLDTSRVTIKGEGTADLGTEQLNLRLTPRPKQENALSLAVPVNVRGTFKDPSFRPDETSVALRVAGAIAVGAVNPLALLVPMVGAGSGDRNPCLAALSAQPAKAPPAAPAQPPAEGGVKGLLQDLRRSLGVP
jgi:uncharacterized protein involved in outer membrane biogenesis